MSASTMAEHFDRKAAEWDANDRHRALTADIVSAVEREWPVDSSPRLLDYGAGTGLCSLALAPRCSSVVAMDVSAGMLSRLEEKARATGIAHLQTLQQDLCSEPLGGQRFDVILCAMTLHHVKDVDILLSRFHSMLEPGGFIAIADLEQEDGTFHDDPAGVHHNGFDRDCLSRKMMAVGFPFVSMETVHRIRKTRDTGIIEYPVFCAIGRMRDAGSAVLDELKWKLVCRPDDITLSGSGEPTLYSRLGELVERIRAMTDVPVAVLTNGSLLWQKDGRTEPS